MSASVFGLLRLLMWCSTRTSIGERSGTPEAAMQRTIQRLKA
ncbi:Uncharacterised protein [Mycobacterium tuberculosis]|nr:Uncharacterised protein [Mycobacterium tuberculosis]